MNVGSAFIRGNDQLSEGTECPGLHDFGLAVSIDFLGSDLSLKTHMINPPVRGTEQHFENRNISDIPQQQPFKHDANGWQWAGLNSSSVRPPPDTWRAMPDWSEAKARLE